MIPPDLDMAVGFVIGAFLAGTVGLLLGAALAAGSQEDAYIHGYADGRASVLEEEADAEDPWVTDALIAALAERGADLLLWERIWSDTGRSE